MPEPTSLNVSWSYSGDQSVVSGYHLFDGDTIVADIPDPAARTFTGGIPLVNGENNFTVKAYGPAGEGPASLPFALTEIPPLVAPENLTVTRV